MNIKYNDWDEYEEQPTEKVQQLNKYKNIGVWYMVAN